MSKCPYTWFKSLFEGQMPSNDNQANSLRVTVSRNSETTVDVSLPARSARWLIDLIPSDVVEKIRLEGIPIDKIQDDLAKRKNLMPEKIFVLDEGHRIVSVWLE